MKKISTLILISILVCCNKTDKMKNKIFPEKIYEKNHIDKFYWVDEGWDYSVIPLIKPFRLQKMQGMDNWMLDTYIKTPKIETFHNQNIVLNNFDPVEKLNVNNGYIYGNQGEILNFDGTDKIDKIWFIINIETKEVKGFEAESAFQNELKNLNLPNTFLNPDDLYDQYNINPVLPWFPDNIKKQLEEIKEKK